MKALVTGLFAHLLVFATAPSLAAEAGRVLLASGNVIAVRGKETVRLLKDTLIQENDVLRTGPASHLHVRFADEAIVSMRENSELRIDEFRFTGKEDGSERMFMSLLKGGLRTITGLIGKTNHQNYRMSTSTAAIGIRGTDYSATLCRQDCRNANGSIAPDGLYGRTHGASSGTNAIDISNAAGSRTIGINENFYVADNKSSVQPLLLPPDFLVGRPQPSGKSNSNGNSNASKNKGQGGPNNGKSPGTVSPAAKAAAESDQSSGTNSAADTTSSTVTAGTNTATKSTGNDSVAATTASAQDQVTVTASSGFQAESRLSSLPQASVQLQFSATETLSAGGTPAQINIISPTIAALAAFNDPNSTETSQGGAFFSANQLVTDPANASSTLTLMQQLTGFTVSGAYEAVTNPNASKTIAGSTTASFVIDETSSNSINAIWGRWMSGSFSNGTISTATFSTNNQFHYLYGPLTPPEVIAAKSGTVSMVDFYGTTPTNQAGEIGQVSFSGSLNVNFSTRSAEIPQVTMTFSSNSEQYSFQSATASIQIRTGQGAFIQSTALGTYTQGQSSESAKLGLTGIFMGTSGNHLGVALNAKTTSGPAASAQAVRLFTCSPC